MLIFFVSIFVLTSITLIENGYRWASPKPLHHQNFGFLISYFIKTSFFPFFKLNTWIESFISNEIFFTLEVSIWVTNSKTALFLLSSSWLYFIFIIFNSCQKLSFTSFQIPAVTNLGPQSQPYWYCAFLVKTFSSPGKI